MERMNEPMSRLFISDFGHKIEFLYFHKFLLCYCHSRECVDCAKLFQDMLNQIMMGMYFQNSFEALLQ